MCSVSSSAGELGKELLPVRISVALYSAFERQMGEDAF